MSPDQIDRAIRRNVGKPCMQGHLIPFGADPRRDCPSCNRQAAGKRRARRAR